MLNGRLTTGQFIYASPKSRLLSDLTPSLLYTTPSHGVAKVNNVKKSIAVVDPTCPCEYSRYNSMTGALSLTGSATLAGTAGAASASGFFSLCCVESALEGPQDAVSLGISWARWRQLQQSRSWSSLSWCSWLSVELQQRLTSETSD